MRRLIESPAISAADGESFYRADVGYFEFDGQDVQIELYLDDMGVPPRYIYLGCPVSVQEEGITLRYSNTNVYFSKFRFEDLRREPDW